MDKQENAAAPAAEVTTAETTNAVPAVDPALAAINEAIDGGAKPEDKPTENADDQSSTATVDGDAKGDAVADEQKPVEKTESAVEKKPSDEFGDLPENANAKTKERFGQLKTKFDEIATERDSYKKTAEINGEVVNLIQSTGASPEMFGGTLEYLRLVNSPKPQDREQALALLDEQRRELALSLGKSVPGVDPLEGFPDLKQKVESLTLSQEDAAELANARRRAVSAEAKAGAHDRHQSEQAALTQANSAVDQLGYKLAAADPQYNVKIQALAPALAIIRRSVPPQQWAQEIEKAYRMLPAIAAPAPTPAIDPPSPAPVRPSASGGANSKSPGSALEAINAALGL